MAKCSFVIYEDVFLYLILNKIFYLFLDLNKED